MRNSIKKYLMLTVIVVAMLVTAFIVSAEGTPYCSDCKNSTTFTGDRIYPTCETGGYVELKCTGCKKVIGKTDITNPNGHSYERQFVKEDTMNYYEHVEVCSSCKNVTHPEPDVKYYKVTFYNTFSTNGTGHYVKDVPYATLVDATDTNAYTTKVLKEDYYVKEGTKAVYTGQCVREADKTFNEYTLKGWVEEAKIINNGSPDFSIIDTRVASKRIYDDKNEYVLEFPERYEAVFGNDKETKPIYMSANGFEVPIEGNVKADYNVYAVFEAKNTPHTVYFKNYAGRIEYTVTNITHGDKVEYDYDNKGVPINPPNHRVYYVFDNAWLYTKDRFEYEIDLNHIYGTITVSPKFVMKSQTYNFKYYDVNGNAYIGADGNEVEELVAIAGPELDDYAPVKGRSIDVKDYFDLRNVYIYTGIWRLRNDKSVTVDINNVTLPTNILSYQEESTGFITLEPSFRTEARVYSMPIKIYYPNDGNNHPEEIDIQITSADNQVRNVKLTEEDIINKKEVHNGSEAPVYQCLVSGIYYSDSYRVTATSRTYQGINDRVLFSQGDPAKMEDDGPYQVEIFLEHLKQKDCNCICHTVFKPIWVAALNLLNTLFGVEYVCCDDMFANIGELLNYGK